jgi:hypothetical protein
MTSRDFCFWLQGYFEIKGGTEGAGTAGGLSAEQAEMIRRHLALVFKHEIDPSAGPPAHQAALDALHKVANQPSAIPGGHGPEGLVYRC